jgi:hypothetical protein
MTDRELLEAAARALGRTGARYEDGEWLEIRYGLKTAIWFDDDEGYWNPLESDADAFRLAVKLGIVISSFMAESYSGENNVARARHFALGEIDEHADDNGGDMMAATRRAIVRAAAAIGEKMKDALPR